MSSDTNTKQNVKEIAVSVIENHTLYETLGDFSLENIIFNDKSLKEWSEHFTINIPRNCNPDDMKSIYSKLLSLLQLCNYLYSKSNSILTLINEGSVIKKSELISSFVKEYEDKKARRPAGTVLEDLAESKLDLAYLKIHAKIVKEFFRDQRDTLIEMRKTLEQMGFSFHLESKLRE